MIRPQLVNTFGGQLSRARVASSSETLHQIRMLHRSVRPLLLRNEGLASICSCRASCLTRTVSAGRGAEALRSIPAVTLPAVTFRSLAPGMRRSFHQSFVAKRPDSQLEDRKSKVAQAIDQVKTVARNQRKGANLSEDIYTIPNLLTTARLISVPFLGYFVLQGQMYTAATLLFVSGVTDLLDGWLARKYNSYTVFGSIADPAADKSVMTVMVICLAIKGLLPVPLAALILGRDIALVMAAFWIRYASLPPPKTFARYWDFSLPSASVQPTQISKYNTFLQLLLVGASTVMPCLPIGLQGDLAIYMIGFQWLVGITTAWSGLSYVFGKGAVTYLNKK